MRGSDASGRGFPGRRHARPDRAHAEAEAATGRTGGGRDAGGSPVVEAVDVHREYRMEGTLVRAVRSVSLSVAPGDFLAVTGPSGSGKSTLVHLLGAVDTATRGTVRLVGTDVARLSDRDRTRLRLHEVGLVFQRFHLLPMLDALENVEVPMAEAGVGRAQRRERARALLERVGLGDRLRHRPGELSGGQRQRVAVARALANGPSLLLADEPTGELDRATGAAILDLFAELAAEGTAVVVATHDEQLAARARRRLELVDGRVAGGTEDGGPEGGAAGRGADHDRHGGPPDGSTGRDGADDGETETP